MIVLSLDTCLAACSAAIIDGPVILGERSEAMSRGHQERIAPMIRELTCDAMVRFAAIDRIAVTVGPGSFTGLRVGLAFAKGLSAAIDRPCLGVGTLEALAAGICVPGLLASVIDAGRGNVFMQVFQTGRSVTPPEVVTLTRAADTLAELRQTSVELTVVGPGSRLLADRLEGSLRIELAAPSPAAVARLALGASVEPVAPLYLRAPDAAPRR